MSHNLLRHHLQDLPPNRQRCRRGGRRHIQDMQEPPALHEPENIHHRAIRSHTLRPHSSPSPRHILHPHILHPPPARTHQLPLPPPTPTAPLPDRNTPRETERSSSPDHAPPSVPPDRYADPRNSPHTVP